MADFNMTVTVSGLKLLTDALAGKMVTLTGIHLGSGSYTGNLSAATQLVQEQIALPLDKIIKGDNQITAKSVLQFRTVETGFIWTEVGLFAKESDGPEILYAYGYAGNKGDYIPGADEATLNEKVIRLTMLSSNEANIVAEVDGSTVYASQEDLDDLRESVELSITNITNIIQQVTGSDPNNPDAAPHGSMVVTLTHTKSGNAHAFTGLGERTGLVPCQFKSTAGYTEGDTATIDGENYIITLTSEDEPETGLFTSGKSILVDVDTEGKTINFKSGGGLTNGKLALADATEDTVFNGRTFYARDKTMRTGRALATPITAKTDDVNPGVTYYNERGELMVGTRKKVAKNEIFMGDGTFTVPEGITSVAVRIFGGGGKGGTSTYCKGGGGGGHMAYGVLDVTPGQQIPVTIGMGGGQSGNSSSTGGTSSFGTLLSAAGGNDGAIRNGIRIAGEGGTGGGGGWCSAGGNGTYGGGGGAGSPYSGDRSTILPGGNGGTYGGGGGGQGCYLNLRGYNTERESYVKSPSSGGTGGTYGGNGGAGGTGTVISNSSGTVYAGMAGHAGTNTTEMELEFTGTGAGGSAYSSTSVSSEYYNGTGHNGKGGGGGGGYGGLGGKGGDAVNAAGGGGGGGGGYGGKGGDGGRGGGGGGGYGGKGGDASPTSSSGCGGGGGGYGLQGNGGSDSSPGGIAAGGGGDGGLGGNGICIVTYLE